MTPTETYGEFLTSHGIWALSYAEWIQVAGAIWVVCLIADFFMRLFRRFKGEK